MPIAVPMSHTLSLSSRSARASTQETANIPAMVVMNNAMSMSSEEILRGQKAVEISHNGSTYRLQATRLGKLILTK